MDYLRIPMMPDGYSNLKPDRHGVHPQTETRKIADTSRVTLMQPFPSLLCVPFARIGRILVGEALHFFLLERSHEAFRP